MEDELRLFLLLGGTVFIIGVLAHGIWKIRKNSKPEEKTRLEPRQWAEDDVFEENGADVDPDDGIEGTVSGNKNQEGFDELGLGAVRVVGKSNTREQEQSDSDDTLSSQPLHSGGGSNIDNSSAVDKVDETASANTSSKRNELIDNEEGVESNSPTSTAEPEAAPEPKLYGSVVSNPKPHMSHVKGPSRGHAGTNSTSAAPPSNVADFPEPPGFLLKEGEEGDSESSASGAHEGGNTEAPANQSVTPAYEPVTRKEPKLYVDPTDEANTETVDTMSAQQREVADFSLDAPSQPERVTTSSERTQPKPDEQPKRFSRNKSAKAHTRKREEPNFGDDQMRIDFDDSDTEGAFSANDTDESASANTKAQSNIEPEVLVLNVRAPEDAPIAGAALLPMLLTLGFKFGDQDIFHRHVNSNGKGPVLFSLANMFKPGVFDIDNLENFETQGVSLFMILPIEGDPHQVFNMMHNAARKLADEFGAQVLDGRRSVLTKQGLQQYVEKIREFERKRMIARN
ncbi:cell division protein ZipA [Alteromonas sp. S167]|uniref:cell division protein ZipA n=1 Tax=Alteromonas sp. S167 TaxID=3117402 RepID=UPI002FE1B3DF